MENKWSINVSRHYEQVIVLFLTDWGDISWCFDLEGGSKKQQFYRAFFWVNGLWLLSSTPSPTDEEPAKRRQTTAPHYSIIKFFTVTLVELFPLCLHFVLFLWSQAVLDVYNTLSDCLNIISLIGCVVIGSFLQQQAAAPLAKKDNLLTPVLRFIFFLLYWKHLKFESQSRQPWKMGLSAWWS